ncbi:hypothetical protein ABH994_001685 [Bradyrhizobium yuanmingense]|uniref:hypothetical protein n=1 Tax=Bradyrhizobium yuanmingense TaxID=108015 RepID=UPI0012FE0B0E|nr:hypothetical protein [Bradyrhizobium yuanmingense]
MSKAKGTRFGPVGQCIYCRCASNCLTEEHIVTAAVSGDLILTEASCSTCQAEINKNIENPMMGMWKDMRYRMGMGSRRKNKRPNKLPLQLATVADPEIGERFIGGQLKIDESQWKPDHVTFDEHPTLLSLYKFDMPGWLRGLQLESDNDDFVRGVWTYQIVTPQQRPALARIRLPLLPYLKLLAKIAHGFAVFRYGIDGFEPFLTDFIRGKQTPHPSLFIGCDWGPIPPATGHPWHVRSTLSPYGGLVLVRVRIFAMLGAPVYLIIVGKHRPESAQREPYGRAR